MKIFINIIILLLTNNLLGQWNQIGDDIYGEPGSNTGTSVSINSTGNRIALYDEVVNGNNIGRARVFEWSNGNWNQIGQSIAGQPTTSNQSHGPLKLNGTGDRLLFGSPSADTSEHNTAGQIRVFEYNGSSWDQVGATISGDSTDAYLGYGLDINASGDKIAVGGLFNSTDDGEVRIYFDDGSQSWEQQGNTITSNSTNDRFGAALSLSADGNTVAISAYSDDTVNQNAGRLEVFELVDNTWTLKGDTIYAQETGDFLGYSEIAGETPISLSANGNIVAVSVPERVDGAAGFVSVYEFDGTNWNLKGNHIQGQSNNVFYGSSLSLNDEGNRLFVADPYNDNARGSVDAFEFVNGEWEQLGERLLGENENEFYGFAVESNGLGSRFVTSAVLYDGNGADSGLVRIYEDASLSIETLSSTNEITLYPNPNNGIFTISWDQQQELIDVKVYNYLGQLIISEEILGAARFTSAKILESGVYSVKVRTQTGEEFLKMIVK